jgi:hypothetical protein
MLPHVEAGMIEISREGWLEELKSSGCLLSVIMHVVNLGRAPLSTPFSDALVGEARGVLSGTSEFGEKPTIHRGNLASALTEESRGIFFKNLRDLFVDHASQPFTSVLAEYGNELNSSTALDDAAAADNVVRRILGGIVDRQVGEELHSGCEANTRDNHDDGAAAACREERPDRRASVAIVDSIIDQVAGSAL